MPFRTTRTVRTIISDGSGPPRVEERTYTDGDDSGGHHSSGMNFDIGGFTSQFGNFGKQFGKQFGTITIGGGDSGRPSRKYTSAGKSSHRPGVTGRSTRKEKKNPFAGYGKQNYDQIVKKCLEEGCLFEDPEFPAEDSSIFFSRAPPRPFEWKRPVDLCEAPQYVAEGASRFDVQQGELGDCWLLAAVASLTCNQHLLNRVILPEQNFTDNYCGVFRFMIWHQGDWEEVVVDDRLPTYYDKLVFMHSTDKNEFWSALLEKAYAKLNGSYESLKGGSTSEAMEDFTGGVTESIDLSKAPPNLLTIMMKARDRGSLMGCSIDADPSQLEAILDNGLVMGHAYSVTAVKLVEIQTPKVSGKIPLVRVRNPWGNESEWKGAWSDSSAEWRYIPDEEKQSLGLTFDDDGEFWMSFQDWQTNFQKLEICNLGPDSLDESEAGQQGIRWEATAEVGEWIPRVNAGGCRNYLETFCTNPQYRVTLVDPDDDEDDLCTMLVGLLQKDRRKKRKEGLDMLTIGYVIYKLKEDNTCSGILEQRFFKYNASVAKSPSFINMREICGRHKLSPGTYVIIPSTFEPNQAGEFLMRIFTEKPGTTQEMDEGTGIVEDQRRRNEQDYGSSMPDPYAGSSMPDPYAGSSVPDPYSGSSVPDPYADKDPPPLGFDLMVKDEYKAPAPTPFNFDHLSPSAPPAGPPAGAGGLPSAPAQGYSSYPYQQPDPSQGHGYPAQGQGYNPYGGAPAPGAAPYQPMPGSTYNQYNPSAGYQPPVQDPYYQNQPHPAYNAGYQPNPYCQMPTPGTGYQTNQYYNNQYSQNQPGFPQAQVPYSAPGSAPYQPPSQSYGGYGDPSQFSQQQNYPYGQGETMERAQSSSSVLYCAPPGITASYSPAAASSPPVRPVQPGQPDYSNYPGRPQPITVGVPPPTALQRFIIQGSGTDNSSGGMRSKAPPRPSRPPRLPSPIIHNYDEAVAFLRKELDKDAPPVTEEDKAQGQALRESFKEIAGEDLEVDAFELKDILNTVFTKEFSFDGFSVDVCRSMVAMHDGDMSGKLGFDEFKELWQDLRKWKAVFKQFDKDNSGRLSSYELRNALKGSGFRLSNRTLSALILRYSDKSGEIEFDDFVLCSIRLKTMIASFKGAQQKEGVAVYDIDTFIQTAMYS